MSYICITCIPELISCIISLQRASILNNTMIYFFYHSYKCTNLFCLFLTGSALADHATEAVKPQAWQIPSAARNSANRPSKQDLLVSRSRKYIYMPTEPGRYVGSRDLFTCPPSQGFVLALGTNTHGAGVVGLDLALALLPSVVHRGLRATEAITI